MDKLNTPIKAWRIESGSEAPLIVVLETMFGVVRLSLSLKSAKSMAQHLLSIPEVRNG